jgi:hypothetical protein
MLRTKWRKKNSLFSSCQRAHYPYPCPEDYEKEKSINGSMVGEISLFLSRILTFFWNIGWSTQKTGFKGLLAFAKL